MIQNLVFVQEYSPLFEDYKKLYSRIRFYSDTIIKFSEIYSCDNIYIIYPESSKFSEKKFYCKEDLDSITNRVNEFENCSYIIETGYKYNKKVLFMTIEEFINTYDYKNYILLFGILNCDKKYLYGIIDEYYSKLIERSLFYHYLSSDSEMTNTPNVIKGKSSFLSEFDHYLNPFIKSKLKSVIITEVKDNNTLENYKNIGITEVKYLPLIIDYENRVLKYHQNFCHKDFSGKCLMLRNLEQWYNEYPAILEIFKNNLTAYDSSMPAIRKRSKPAVDEYGIIYKNARFWTLNQIVDILTNYTYYIGASSPRYSKFTYKIVESSAAKTVCISPMIDLSTINLEDSLCQSIIDKYKEIFILKDPNKIIELVSNCNLSKRSYDEFLSLQLNFIKDYFDINSANINYCFESIV